MEGQETNLKDEIKKLNENFNQLLSSGKIKGVKAKKLSRTEKKKGFVRYIVIDENAQLKVIKVKIEEGTTMLDGVPRIATPDYLMSWDGEPTIIQPAWSVEPLIPREILEQSKRDNMIAVGWRLLANRFELGKVAAKKNIPGWLIFAGIIGLIVVGYLLLK